MLVRVTLAFLVGWVLPGAEEPAPRVAPVYVTASIVNAADNQSDMLAPNTIATIYGANLAYGTAAITANDVRGGILPTVLGSSETQVFVNNYAADLYYVSPTQINFLVPPNQLPQPSVIQVVIDSLAGPPIHVTLGRAAPGLFQMYLPDVKLVYAVASRPDGSVLTTDSPASPGDIIILWATGLGETAPPAVYGQLPTAAAPLIAGADLSILLDGVPVGPYAIYYAGVAPGYAGLYQINLILPKSTGQNPEIRLKLDGASSVAGVHIPVGS